MCVDMYIYDVCIGMYMHGVSISVCMYDVCTYMIHVYGYVCVMRVYKCVHILYVCNVCMYDVCGCVHV